MLYEYATANIKGLMESFVVEEEAGFSVCRAPFIGLYFKATGSQIFHNQSNVEHRLCSLMPCRLVNIK